MGDCQDTIALVISIIILVLLVAIVIYLASTYSSAACTPSTVASAARVATTKPTPVPPRRYDVSNVAGAPMPSHQLMTPNVMPDLPGFQGMPTASMSVGNAPTTTNESSFSAKQYAQDPAMMTAPNKNDVQSMKQFLPNMMGALQSANGPVNPDTGLPLITHDKLARAQSLGGFGAGSFLRPVQDPLTGYKKTIGKDMRGAGHVRQDLQVRRAQINAARLNDANADPILFQGSEFMYG